MRKYWIFVVDDNTWLEHQKAGIAAINEPDTESGKQSAIAEIIGVKPGDYILFNLRVSAQHPPQIIGLYEATSEPYYDSSPLFPGAQFVREKLPYRIGFKQVINFKNPLDFDEIWYLKERGILWTLQQTRGAAVGIHASISLTRLEGEMIVKLLEMNNPKKGTLVSITPQIPTKLSPLPINLTVDSDGNLHYEHSLKALLIKGLKNGEYKEIFGDYDDFIPNVPTGSRKEIDILLIKYDNHDIIWYEIVELKSITFTINELQRLIDYEKWLIKMRALTPLQVHSIAVAYKFDDEVKTFVRKRLDYKERPIRLIEYRFDSSSNKLLLSEIQV
jgi:predicted RNA-binding protein